MFLSGNRANSSNSGVPPCRRIASNTRFSWPSSIRWATSSTRTSLARSQASSASLLTGPVWPFSQSSTPDQAISSGLTP
jgi:hypothetical protein